MLEIDEYAERVATERFGLPQCLHVPIAARNEAAVRGYVGDVRRVLGSPSKAFLIENVRQPKINANLPIWRIPESTILHFPQQVWVHVDYKEYRRAYALAFPDQDVHSLVLDHVMNRRAARVKGFSYLRVVPISRQANSSSGGLSEKWAVEYHSSPKMREKNLANPAKIQHADLADIVKMLNRKTGGSLQDLVNDAQALIREDC